MKKIKITSSTILIIFLLVILILGFSYLSTYFILKGIVWALELNFVINYKIAFGIWLIIFLISSIFPRNNHVKN